MIEVLEKQKEEHQQIIEEQKEVLDKMKQHLEADEEVKKKDEDIIGQNQMPQQQVHFSDFLYRARILNTISNLVCFFNDHASKIRSYRVSGVNNFLPN